MKKIIICNTSKGAFKYHVSAFGGGAGLIKNADTADAGEGVGGSLMKC